MPLVTMLTRSRCSLPFMEAPPQRERGQLRQSSQAAARVKAVQVWVRGWNFRFWGFQLRDAQPNTARKRHSPYMFQVPRIRFSVIRPRNMEQQVAFYFRCELGDVTSHGSQGALAACAGCHWPETHLSGEDPVCRLGKRCGFFAYLIESFGGVPFSARPKNIGRDAVSHDF